MLTLDLSMIAFVATDGTLVHGRMIDPVGEKLIELRPDPPARAR